LSKITEITARDTGHGLRSVHAKSHALLGGTLTVEPNLPPSLAQGLFSKSRSYSCVMRFSTIPGDVLDDKVSVPRGLAFKVLGVEGERLSGSESETTQDFVFGNGETFSVSTAAKFLGSLRLLAQTTDRAEWAKKLLSVLTRGLERGLEAVGTNSPVLMTFGGYPHTNPASDTYFSQTPYRYGDYVSKFCLVPVSQNLIALKDQAVDLSGGPDGLRKAMRRTFAEQGGKWELRAQLLTNLLTIPIEDPSLAWPVSESPYLAIARLEVDPQSAWTIARAKAVDDQMAFSPWHGLAAHRPLGSVNRVRKSIYESSVARRSAINACPIHEPAFDQKLPPA
jgi:hypothetical protein